MTKDILKHQYNSWGKQTNFDHIKTMDDKELANMLSTLGCHKDANRERCIKYNRNCNDCWLEWLNESERIKQTLLKAVEELTKENLITPKENFITPQFHSLEEYQEWLDNLPHIGQYEDHQKKVDELNKKFQQNWNKHIQV